MSVVKSTCLMKIFSKTEHAFISFHAVARSVYFRMDIRDLVVISSFLSSTLIIWTSFVLLATLSNSSFHLQLESCNINASWGSFGDTLFFKTFGVCISWWGDWFIHYFETHSGILNGHALVVLVLICIIVLNSIVIWSKTYSLISFVSCNFSLHVFPS